LEILIGVASFFGGCFLTAVGFIFGFSNKVSVMQTTLNELKNSFEQHIETAPTCRYHTDIKADIAVLKSKAGG
jgi:hypothetical protein